MKTSRSRIIVAFLLCAVLISGFVIGRASADQPHMQAALEHLRAAKGELEKAEADKGGHRVKALSLVNDAIAQVERGVGYDRHH
jgi:lipopolysaccharide export LptBFGC system permease protein LptF